MSNKSTGVGQTVLKYTIRSGDTYTSIAEGINQATGVTYQQIAAANPDVDPDRIQIGQVLNIPSPQNSTDIVLEYTVVSGDTLSGIADNINDASGVSTNDIEAANPSVEPSKLQIGQVINIPGSTESGGGNGVVQAQNMGYWYWTWSTGEPFSEATLSMAFSGYTDPAEALQNSASILSKLVGTKYISLGGGNDAGSFSASRISDINTAIQNGDFSDYDGIAYDIEEGDSGLSDDFAASFALAKSNGFKVLVTVSHSAPYGISDAADLMNSFFANEDIDFLSPQLYTTGKEAANDYDISHGVKWSEYAGAKAAIVPSIVDNSYYPDAQTYFEGEGVVLQGYVQWKQIT
jgi:LysM repeat protein